MSVPATPNTVSGIADLTYRHYDGPLKTRSLRFWTVALAVIRTNRRKPAFWIVAGMTMLLYFILALIFYFTRNVNQMTRMGTTFTYAATAYQAITSTAFLIFLTTLVVGAGSIAADNRANALLVYLSKPFTKGDYLLGKWVGVFVLVAAVSLVPTMLLYLFFLTAYYEDGFLRQNPWLWPRMLGASLLGPLVNTSLIVGFSAWSKNPRLAGALFAAFYIILSALTGSAGMFLLRKALMDEDEGARPTVVVRAMTITYLSTRGCADGLAMNLLQVEPREMPFGPPGARRFADRLRRPDPLPLAALALVLIVVPLSAARIRIRAVEVVTG